MFQLLLDELLLLLHIKWVLFGLLAVFALAHLINQWYELIGALFIWKWKSKNQNSSSARNRRPSRSRRCTSRTTTTSKNSNRKVCRNWARSGNRRSGEEDRCEAMEGGLAGRRPERRVHLAVEEGTWIMSYVIRDKLINLNGPKRNKRHSGVGRSGVPFEIGESDSERLLPGIVPARIDPPRVTSSNLFLTIEQRESPTTSTS